MEGKFENPNGCRYCGIGDRGHMGRWTKSAGWHQWTPPTQQQIKQRMQARHAARLNAPPPKYHATTRWTGTSSDPDDEGYDLCADCGTQDCPQYQRIQTRRAKHSTGPAAQYSSGPWNSEATLSYGSRN